SSTLKHPLPDGLAAIATGSAPPNARAPSVSTPSTFKHAIPNSLAVVTTGSAAHPVRTVSSSTSRTLKHQPPTAGIDPFVIADRLTRKRPGGSMIDQESQDGPERAVRSRTSIPAFVPKREDLWPDLEQPGPQNQQHNLIAEHPQTPPPSRRPPKGPIYIGKQRHTARDSALRQGSTIDRSHSNPSPETAGGAHADRAERSGQDQFISMREAPQQAEDLAAARQVKDFIAEDQEKMRAIRRLISHSSQRNAFDNPSEHIMPLRVSDRKDSTLEPDAPEASGYVQTSGHPSTRHSMASNADEDPRYSIGRPVSAIQTYMPGQQTDILPSREDRLSRPMSRSSTYRTQSSHKDEGRLDDASSGGHYTPNTNARSFLRRTATQTPVTPGTARTSQAQPSHEDDASGGGHDAPSANVRSFLRRIATQTTINPGTAHTPQTDYRAGLKHGTPAVQRSLRKMTSSPALLREAPKSALDHSRHRSPNPLEGDCGYCEPQDAQPGVPGSPTAVLDDVRSVSPPLSYHTAGSTTSSRLLRRAGDSTASLRTSASASASASACSSIRASQPSTAPPPLVTPSRTRTIRPSASVDPLFSPNHTGKAGTSLPPQPEPALPSRHSDLDCEQKAQQHADLVGAMKGLKATITSETGQLERKVGDSNTRQRTRGGEENEAGIQTDGTLVLIRGITVTLHMKDEKDDLVLRADLEGRGLGVGE
ncbi:hypothetical protein GE09DRAFT_120943, partial [Coniochaeta sp. 2T2.1]